MHSRALRTLAPVSLAALSTLVACAAAEGNDQLAGGAGEGTGGTENGGQGGSTSTGGVSGTTPLGGTGNPTGGTGNPTGGATATGGTGNPTGGTGNPTGGTTSTGGTGMMPPGRQTIPLPYTDDFETSEARDWRFISVPWTVVADDTNVLQLSGTGDSETTWAVGGDRNWTDVRVSMKVKFVSGDAMILLSPRWANLDSYAFVEYEAEDKPKLRSRVNGSTSDLITAAETITFATGMWHTVVVTIVGTTTTLEIDGTMIGMNASSTLAPSGGIGIAVENGIVAIDDVSVTAP
jgi:hypothetical protein